LRSTVASSQKKKFFDYDLKTKSTFFFLFVLGNQPVHTLTQAAYYTRTTEHCGVDFRSRGDFGDDVCGGGIISKPQKKKKKKKKKRAFLFILLLCK
jgi:hypothetical protein